MDAIETSDLAAVRHLIRVSDFDEGHREFYGNFAEEIARDYREGASSIFKSKRDLLRTAAGSILSINFFGAAIACGNVLLNNPTEGDALIALVLLPGSLVLSIGALYWAKRGLACPHAQSKLLKAQRVLDYIKNCGKSETSSSEGGVSKEEGKPA